MPHDHLVLIVDDNHDLVETTCELLQLYGINAQPCFSGKEAIALARELRPEVVVLDIAMPAPDGFATFSAIRELHGCSTIPIIAVTAYSDAEHSQRIRSFGFTTHLVKPVKIELLAATIRKLAQAQANRAWLSAGRHDVLMAQRLEVALVYRDMLGTDAAKKYLESLDVPLSLAERVLASERHRN